MQWLESLDTRVFYFVNHGLSNPLFDWLMPRLSGGRGVMEWFVPAAVLALLVAVFFGSVRARLCALMIFLVVALGDPLVLNTVKHVIHRPRPCMALPNVIERLGCTPSGSMPSAHAGNWFAAAMLVFLFYRHKRPIFLSTLFMACAVAFSRVYNGVHYPGDVLAGAILGAGYAAALAITLQSLWNVIGKKWFPLWHSQCPSLLNPSAIRHPASAEPHPQSEILWLRLGVLVILVMLIGRWIYLAAGGVQLSQDEAYQWVWSKHPALSYYSKPPGIALIQFAGTRLFGDTEFGVRFFSPLFAAIVSFMLLRFFAREVGSRPSFWLLLVGMATPLLGAGAVLMTIDPPLVLCWTWAMIAGWRAAQPDGKTRQWLVVGLAMGLGFLCKYTAILQIPCWAIFLALSPLARPHLRRPGPWLALLVFFLCASPVVLWNWRHGWVTVRGVADDAGMQTAWHPTLRYFWDFVGQEFGLLNPFFFIAALWAMFAFWRTKNPLRLYFFSMGAPVFLGYWLFSFHSRVLPNWIAVAILPMFCLMVAWWDEKFRAGWRFVKPLFVVAVATGIFAVVVMYHSPLLGKITGRPLPDEKDPTRRVQGWRQSAAIVEAAREKLAARGKPAFILCGHYGITGLYSFYIPRARKTVTGAEPLVYVMESDRPENQFYFWPQYDYRRTRKGQNAIFVSEANLYKLQGDWLWQWVAHRPLQRSMPAPVSLPHHIAAQFQSVTDLGERDVRVKGRVCHRIHLWACYDLK
ncbi:MAG: glycosyltransferase family 39 protein [Verrucomicrobia bacterium]|nr:glycosyltransferase family 39 protein [Verrucomicrobiota bacterium]MDE3100010.1 glycosyltransferase family 39 protein [Verrucomicrobiota bacterium]